VEYCEWGEGLPLLLAHGVAGGCDVPPSWRALVLSGYRIIAPSRFGYLGADMRPDPSVPAQGDVFAAFLDTLGIERAVVLGFSAGTLLVCNSRFATQTALWPLYSWRRTHRT
jgi:pimeloyl-ACP methyl ester carboxylesterase